MVAGSPGVRLRLHPAGHILGSAFAELDITQAGQPAQRVVFSGDLGAPYTPLLPAPKPPMRADVLVLESTYGDRTHDSRKTRRQRLQRCASTRFPTAARCWCPPSASAARKSCCTSWKKSSTATPGAPRPGLAWGDVQIVGIDSPLAADFTAGYAQLRDHWDAEARRKLAAGRHPLAFDQVTTVAVRHAAHLQMVQGLAQSARPAIVIAASGMCSGGRIVQLPEGHAGRPAA